MPKKRPDNVLVAFYNEDADSNTNSVEYNQTENN